MGVSAQAEGWPVTPVAAEWPGKMAEKKYEFLPLIIRKFQGGKFLLLLIRR